MGKVISIYLWDNSCFGTVSMQDAKEKKKKMCKECLAKFFRASFKPVENKSPLASILQLLWYSATMFMERNDPTQNCSMPFCHHQNDSALTVWLFYFNRMTINHNFWMGRWSKEDWNLSACFTTVIPALYKGLATRPNGQWLWNVTPWFCHRSYGIVMWEMATLAAQPYQGLSNEEVVKFVSDGRFMEEPPRCPPKV